MSLCSVCASERQRKHAAAPAALGDGDDAPSMERREPKHAPKRDTRVSGREPVGSNAA